MSELSAAERDAIIRSMLGSFALDGIDVTYADADRVLAEVEREPLIELYAEIMRGYVRPTAFGALEAYDAALRALYPPPVIITSDHTGRLGSEEIERESRPRQVVAKSCPE